MKNECPKHQYASDLYRCPYCAADQSNSSSMACSTDLGPMEKLESIIKNIPDARVRLKARDLWKRHCRGPVELYQIDGGIRFVFEDWQLVLSVR